VLIVLIINSLSDKSALRPISSRIRSNTTTVSLIE
jgi:hypothetical protein